MSAQVLEYLLLALGLLASLNSIHKAETSFPLALAGYLIWRLQKVAFAEQSLKLVGIKVSEKTEGLFVGFKFQIRIGLGPDHFIKFVDVS